MAGEIQYRGTETGVTLYATIRSKTGTQWNTAGTPNFEAVTAANWADYDVALAETTGNYFYVGTFPAIAGNMVAGWYWVDVFKRAGGTPAITDALQGTIIGYWDGTNLLPWAGKTQEVANDAITAAAIAAGAIDFATFAADCKTGAGLKANVESITANVIDATAIKAGAIDAATFAADVAAAVAGWVWTALTASYGGVGSYGQMIQNIIDDTGVNGVVVAAASKTGYTLTATTGLGNQTANITGNLSGSVGSVTAGVALTAGERTTLAAAIEAAIINELDGTAVMQAIADLIASDMTTTDLTVAAIASAARDAILNRVLAGNHDTAGSVGKVLQDVLEDTGTTLPATLTTITAYVDCLPVSWVTVPTAAQNSTQVASDLAAAHGAGSWVTATSVTVSDKTGFKLASDGLDSVATTAPTGPAANFREMIVQTWRRFFRKSTRTYTGGTQQIVTYADNGTTPITTQTISDDATTETQGTAT